MRALLAGREFPVALMAEGSLIALGELLFMALLYGRVYRHTVRTGLLARYSAEGAA
jgi:ABC-2 type transport system permease protein